MSHYPKTRFWKNWDHYSIVRAVMNKLKKEDTAQHRTFLLLELHLDNSGKLDNEVGAYLINQILQVVFHRDYKEFYPSHVLVSAYLGILMNMIPLIDSQDSRGGIREGGNLPPPRWQISRASRPAGKLRKRSSRGCAPWQLRRFLRAGAYIINYSFLYP